MNIFMNGCFDGLHDGHRKLLNVASSLGKVYVGLNSDRSVRSLKGYHRPFYLYEQRQEQIKELIQVERWYCLSSEDDILYSIKDCQADYIVKGADTLMDKIYSKITGRELVKAVIYVDHGNLHIHTSDRKVK